MVGMYEREREMVDEGCARVFKIEREWERDREMDDRRMESKERDREMDEREREKEARRDDGWKVCMFEGERGREIGRRMRDRWRERVKD
jgi:hypothetical protein